MKTSPSRFLPPIVLLALLVLGNQSARSQKSFSQAPASQRQLISIKVTGSKRFKEEAIVAATGMHLGTTVEEDDFKKAARNLADTGAFTDIGYTFSFSSAGTKVEFQVTDAPKFVPARFEDFVWFPEAEIRQRIQEHAPLFDGEIPASGRMLDEVSDVLQAMLVEKGIPGHVDYVKTGKEDGPVEAIQFKVSEVLIRVRNIKFTGVGEAERPALEAASKRLGDRQYSKSRLNLFAQRELLPVFKARGYLKATFSDPQPEAVADAEPAEEGPRNQSVVDVTFAVTPGLQYKLKTIVWSGNHEFPTETLEKMVRAEIGQPVNMVRLTDNLRDIQTLYGSHGFLRASIKASADFDDATSTATIHLEAKEDAVYHMGDLEFRGIDNSLTAKLRNAWKIRQGEVYDATYLDQYLPEALKLLPANFDWEVAPHVTANVRDKTVDVDLIYSMKAPK